jgi:hypothetical protein
MSLYSVFPIASSMAGHKQRSARFQTQETTTLAKLIANKTRRTISITY